MPSCCGSSQWTHKHRRRKDMLSEGHQIPTRCVAQCRWRYCELLLMAQKPTTRGSRDNAKEMVREDQTQPLGCYQQGDRYSFRWNSGAKRCLWEGHRADEHRGGDACSHSWGHLNLDQPQGRSQNCSLYQRHYEVARILLNVQYSRLQLMIIWISHYPNFSIFKSLEKKRLITLFKWYFVGDLFRVASSILIMKQINIVFKGKTKKRNISVTSDLNALTTEIKKAFDVG